MGLGAGIIDGPPGPLRRHLRTVHGGPPRQDQGPCRLQTLCAGRDHGTGGACPACSDITDQERFGAARDLWVIVLGSVNIIGIEAAANVAARGDLANALGEGFADGLDVGGF